MGGPQRATKTKTDLINHKGTRLKKGCSLIIISGIRYMENTLNIDILTTDV